MSIGEWPDTYEEPVLQPTYVLRKVPPADYEILLWKRLGRLLTLRRDWMAYTRQAQDMIRRGMFSTYLALREIGKGEQALKEIEG